MIISAVADPRIFGSQVIVDEFTKREVIRFLESVAENGVLIDDSDHHLIKESICFASQLGSGFGQRIVVFLQEFLTKAKKYLVSSGARVNQPLYRSAPEGQLAGIAAAMRVDAILTSKPLAPRFQPVCSTQIAFGIVQVEDWSVHPLETHRKQLLHPDSPLDQLTSDEREERVGRALKYALSIKVLDAYLVASERRTSKFCKGISYFISVWQRWTLFPSARLAIEIYTLGNCTTQNGFLSGREAADRLKRLIVEPLQGSHRCVASACVKMDCDPPIFHARFIQAKVRNYSIDPGFDGFDQNGPMRRCFFRLESAGESHVAECLRLPNAL